MFCQYTKDKSRNNKARAFLAAFLAFAMILLSGCQSNEQQKKQEETETPEITATVVPTAEPEATQVPATPTPEITPEPTPEEPEISPQQRNAINMLNYIRAMAQDIRSSSNSRLAMEEYYSELLNNTDPSAVDQETLDEVMSLLDTLEKYRMIAVKRERLQYLYEQNKAQAIHNAIPNPLGLISAVGSVSPAKLAASVIYMAIDAVSSYQSASSQADLQYLKDGWQLDDEEATNLHESRKRLYTYMVNICNDYGIDGKPYALNEDQIDEFVAWKENTNIVRRIQFLESNEETYSQYPPYWLVLAESYYSNEEYARCLECISKYEELDMNILRLDIDYAHALPMAIVSAEYTLSTEEYVKAAENYCDKILANIKNDDWSLRYFVEQIYVNLYGKTNDRQFLEKAYNMAVDSVNYLIDEQLAMNELYMSEVEQIAAPKGETADKKKEREQYNKMLVEKRKKELPPVSEPLLLNCELLFSLAEELQIDETEKARVEKILHPDGVRLFLSNPLDNTFSYEEKSWKATEDIDVGFNGKEFIVPALYVTENSEINCTTRYYLSTANEYVVLPYNAWSPVKVERKDKEDLEQFKVTYSCDGIKIKANMIIEIVVKTGDYEYLFTYGVKENKIGPIFTGYSYERLYQ